MAKLFNLTRVLCSTTGTGTLSLGAAVSGFLTFAQAGVQNADVVAYCIRDGGNSEVGYGTYTSASATLTRTVRKSTNSDAAINLSGNAVVFIAPSAEDLDAAAVLALLLTVDGAGSGLDADLLDGNSSAFFSPASVSGTAAAILASLLTVDGAGSGLDADLLDGSSSAAFQPVDSDLTAIAALTTTAFGRSVLEAANAAALATLAGVGTGDSPQFTAVNLNHASDTPLTRASAGVMAVAGVPVYSNIPQNSQSAAYTTVLADAQKHILHPTADNNARTFTIDSNANVAYPIGTAITFVNQINTVTIAITADTLVLAGPGTTGSRTLAANGVATALKIATTTWMVSGTGLT